MILTRNNERGLRKVSSDVKQSIVHGSPILKKIKGNERRELIKLRSEIYERQGIKEFRVDGKDPFDKSALFFALYGYDETGERKLSKALRLVNRKNLGILPTELNLKSDAELNDFFRNYSSNGEKNVLRESTLDNEDRGRLTDLIKKYNESDSVYEAGGLFGFSDDQLDGLVLILGIGQIGCREKWDLVIQTNHPRHSLVYRSIGFPYKLIAGHNQSEGNGAPKKCYFDYCGRPAQTIALEGEEFREAYRKIQENFKGD